MWFGSDVALCTRQVQLPPRQELLQHPRRDIEPWPQTITRLAFDAFFFFFLFSSLGTALEGSC